MKTREEQRMMLAGMAMQGILANHAYIEEIRALVISEGGAGKITLADAIATNATTCADALLAELDRTAPKPETPSPDADGWIPHEPGDPMPCDGRVKVSVKHASGEVANDMTAEFWGPRGPEAPDWWTGHKCSPEMQIIAWKPA